jgi:hypothetical protein
MSLVTPILYKSNYLDNNHKQSFYRYGKYGTVYREIL